MLTEFIADLFTAKLFWVVFGTFLVAHIIKVFAHYTLYDQWDFRQFYATGGMPSSHTAVTVALTVGVAFEQGPSPLFIACAIFSLIVIRDSFGVRQAVSDQAHILNTLSHEMNLHKKARIVSGHTPTQVVAGMFLGVLISILIYTLV